jgi:hypothetical protein
VNPLSSNNRFKQASSYCLPLPLDLSLLMPVKSEYYAPANAPFRGSSNTVTGKSGTFANVTTKTTAMNQERLRRESCKIHAQTPASRRH